jgi:hypothetical protein
VAIQLLKQQTCILCQKNTMVMLQILLQNTEKTPLNEDYQMLYFPSLLSSETPCYT